MGLQSKFTVYAALAGLFVMMGFIFWYATLDNPQLEQVEIQLQDVTVKEVNDIDNRIKLEVVFLVKNPSEKTFTIPLITYDLSADGVNLGSGQYSTQDIAMPGRAAFYAGAEIPLKNFFYLVLDETNSEVYNEIVNGEKLNFSAEGVITAETSWSIIEKEFQSSQ